MLLSLASLFETLGRPLCRPLLFVILLVSSVEAQQDALTEGVRVAGPAPSGLLIPLPGRNPAPNADAPVGSGLLRFYGCVTCHDLALPPFRGRWGPDLDTVGSKTTSQWLDRFLSDPSEARPGGRMPKVPMSDATRRALVSWLSSLRGKEWAWTQQDPDPSLNGERLYRRGDCASCHRLNGEGGARGPALDGARDRIQPEWLAEYLMNPNRMIRNSRMPLFDWEEREAVALAHFLAGPQRANTIEDQNSAQIVGQAAQLGCFQCHKIGKYASYLEMPEKGSGDAFLRYHASSQTIPIVLSEAQIAAMREALGLPTSKTVSDSVFLARFWDTPIRMQGRAPSAHDSLSSSLTPSDCATCHIKQHAEWRSSLHASAMGPGVLGQFVDTAHSNASFAEGCQPCHAPNEEQHAALQDTHGYAVNYQFDTGLRSQGVTCIACHVREHTRFGPPVSETPPAKVWAGPGHGGGHEATAFTSSAFCSSCHQFAKSDRAMNGKLLQDTFAEWQASPHAARGETCQSCHMPDRSHKWLGIHDSTTVANAVKVELEDVLDDSAVIIRLTNEGAGHHLPTYVTPKLFVSATQYDSKEQALDMTEQVRAVGREIVLTSAESREVYDTRIPAGGTWEWVYDAKRHPSAKSVRVVIDVFPDHFYERFFKGYNKAGLSEEAANMIKTAGRQAASSNFRIYDALLPLPDK